LSVKHFELIKNYSIFYSNFEIKSMVHIYCNFWLIDYCLMSSEQYFCCIYDETKFFNILQQYRNESWDYHGNDFWLWLEMYGEHLR